VNATERGPALAEQRQTGGRRQDPAAAYSDARRRIRGLVGVLVEQGSTVAVVSKGDQELVRLESGQGWHFPRTTDGRYAGHHPGHEAEAIAHLEHLRRQGADYFLLPSIYFWWLDHYGGLARHLRSRYRLVADCPDTCLIYDLRRGPAAAHVPAAMTRTSSEGANRRREQNPLVPAMRALLDSLLPAHEPVLVVSEDDGSLLRLGRTALQFPEVRGTDLPLGSLDADTIAARLTTALQARGLRYVVVPAGDGVSRSGVLRDVLRERGREVAVREGICAIYEIEPGRPVRTSQAGRRLPRLLPRGRGRSDD
jgi:hypothetical protein